MKKGHDLKIREKLSKSYLQVIFIASISAIVGIGALLIMTRMYNNALTNYGFSQGDIGKAMTVFADARSDLRGAVGYDEEGIVKELKEDYYVKQDSFNTYLAEVEKSMVTKAGRDVYNQILADLDGYWELSDELIEIGATTDEAGSKEAQDRAVKELKPMYEAVYNDLEDLMIVNVQKGDQLESILAVMEIIVVIIMIAVIIISVLSGRRFGNQIADGIAKPLQQMSERLKTFAEGDLDSEFPEHDAKDEVAEMIETARQMADNLNVIISDSGRLLNEMADGNFAIATDHEEIYTGKFNDLLVGLRNMNRKINDSLRQVEETAEQVSLGSGNMAEAAQSLAEGATEQAGAVEELQATIADITANVEHTAADLQKSHADARKYADDADHSREQMHAMVEAMQRISESSMKIENIISELEDIASQTNLLSLNASIEAARAGEAGKGFAVVADQIRKLAEQSAASAVSTRELIEGSIHDVEDGNKAVALVSETLDEVIKGINDIADTSKSLSENSQSQATAMEQAEQGVNQISEVVQSNSAMAQETSATSEELSAQAETLDNLVRQFKLREQK
ncbi:MAG: methyl-accepting chemotaxis protein [Roseburia inulinivorans]|nr:methyl-accepting chemotaxis protein [bacterium]MDY3040654.1 methyl-accepting chemotaxis protein [Roseburia inulinivorans]